MDYGPGIGFASLVMMLFSLAGSRRVGPSHATGFFMRRAESKVPTSNVAA